MTVAMLETAGPVVKQEIPGQCQAAKAVLVARLNLMTSFWVSIVWPSHTIINYRKWFWVSSQTFQLGERWPGVFHQEGFDGADGGGRVSYWVKVKGFFIWKSFGSFLLPSAPCRSLLHKTWANGFGPSMGLTMALCNLRRCSGGNKTKLSF